LTAVRQPCATYLLLCLAAILGLSQSAQAQVGLASSVAQITLVARAAPGGRLPDLDRIREIRRGRGIREGAATLRFSTNTAYRLIARRLANSGSRVWVRSAKGEYQELRADAPVTVLVQETPAQDMNWELQFRQETTDRSGPTAALPIRYDLVISPSL
jgi:hypothetical protein